MSQLNICARRSGTLICFTGVWLLLSIMTSNPAPAASYDQYVKKYDNIEISDHGLEKLKEYQELIEYFCSFAYFQPRYKVHPDFIRALILAESEANPEAVSRKDARGLGQILPETGRIAARELYERQTDFSYVPRARLKNVEAEDLHDPGLNILLTCYLISKYNYQYDGRLQLVVSAWNAGANAIDNNEPPNYRETLELIGRVNGYFKYLISQKKKPDPAPPATQARFTNR